MQDFSRQVCFFIDDDAFWRSIWEFTAIESGVFLKTLDQNVKVEDLLVHPKDTHFYIDQELGSQKGSDIAKGLFDHGFRNLTLCTCHDPQSLSKNFPWISAVQGKSPPWATS